MLSHSVFKYKRGGVGWGDINDSGFEKVELYSNYNNGTSLQPIGCKV